MRTVPRFALLILAAWLALAADARAQKITIWTTEFERQRVETVRYLANAFAAERKGIEIDVVGVNENRFFQRYESAKRDGAAPDLIDAGGILLNALALAGYLDAAAATDAVERIGRDRFFDGALRAVAAPGGKRVFAVPFRQWIQAVWYRADWFAKAGLSPPNTWQRLLAAARHFHNPEHGDYGIVIGTGADIYAEQIFTQLALSNGARLFDRAGKFAPDLRRFAETFAFYKALAQYAPEGEVSWKHRELFLSDAAAMMFYSTYITDDIALARESADLSQIRTAAGGGAGAENNSLIYAVDLVPIIEGTTRAGYGEFSALAVSTGIEGPKRDAVRGLVQFLYRDDIYVSWLHMAPGGMLPVLRDTAKRPGFFRDPQGIYRRFGRARILEFFVGLDEIEPFGLYTRGDVKAVASLARSKFLPKLIHDVVRGALSPEAAAQRIAGISLISGN